MCVLIGLKFGLRIFVTENERYSDKRYRFAVVDLDKPVDYPRNFVCLLPLNFNENARPKLVFMQIFGDKSVEKAKMLLEEALETEQDSGVKAEIMRRMNLLEPKHLRQIRCSNCGKVFHPRRVRRYSRNLCEECLRKKYAARE